MKSNTASSTNWIEFSIDDIKADEKAAIAIGPFGSRMKSDCYVETGIPVIRGTNLTGGRSFDGDFVYITKEKADELSSSNVREGDLVFPHRGAIGEVGIVPNDKRYVMSTSLMKLTCDKSKAEPLFLFYYFKSPTGRYELLKNSSQVGTPGIGQPLASLKSIRLILPPIQDQRAIAHILGTLDDKIELNRKMNQTLEAMARAIFKSWFVDFDPVRAKVEGHDSGLPADLTALFPDGFEDSELGEIPKGWRVRKLSEVSSQITKGTTPTQEDSNRAPVADTYVNYLRVNAISEDGSFLYDKLTAIPEFVHRGVLKRSILQANDVVYTIAGTIGRIAIIEDDLLPANTNQAVAIIRPKLEVSPAFLVLAMRQKVFQEALHSKIVHAVQANLSLGMISEAKLVLPSESVFAKIFSPVEEIVKKIIANHALSRTLIALRDALLPKLLSGEIRVKNAEKFIEATL